MGHALHEPPNVEDHGDGANGEDRGALRELGGQDGVTAGQQARARRRTTPHHTITSAPLGLRQGRGNQITRNHTVAKHARGGDDRAMMLLVDNAGACRQPTHVVRAPSHVHVRVWLPPGTSSNPHPVSHDTECTHPASTSHQHKRQHVFNRPPQANDWCP